MRYTTGLTGYLGTTTPIHMQRFLRRLKKVHPKNRSVNPLPISNISVLQEASHSVNIIIDSTDTLLENTGDLSGTYKCLSSLYSLVKKHASQSPIFFSLPTHLVNLDPMLDARLILHILSPSPLLPLITSTLFSASLVHLAAHPPVLLRHISSEFLIPPPPLSSLSKFWSVFLPVSERIHDTERLVFGSGGEGCEHPSEIVIELIVREGNGRKRGVERVLEGWSSKGFCQLTALESLKDLMKKQKEVRSVKIH